MMRRRVLLSAVLSVVATGMTTSQASAADDYPSKWRDRPQDSVVDDWGLYNRECVSFVAFRLSTRNGFTIPSAYGGASEWAGRARREGYAVDSRPAFGAVAWTSGHVAWVKAVNGSHVVIEEYNYGYDGRFNERTVPASLFSYIHFKDKAAPAPAPAPWGGVGGASFRGGDSLSSGATMHRNQYVLSSDGRFALLFQPDGNLVAYHGKRALWASGTAGKGADVLKVQGDGNVVLYAGSRARWATGTSGSGARFVMQSDGNIVNYLSGKAKWASNTAGGSNPRPFGSDRLKAGQSLTRGQFLRSKDKRHFLLLQNDGNAVLHGPGYHVLWSSRTGGSGGDRLTVQGDGNVVLYAGARALWASNTRGSGAEFVVQNDGNLVNYVSGRAKWASNTAGRV